MAIASFEPGTRQYQMQTWPLVGGCHFCGDRWFPDQPAAQAKFMRNVPELLVHVATLESHEMEAALAQAFHDWKGDEEQVDDVLVVGVRV